MSMALGFVDGDESERHTQQSTSKFAVGPCPDGKTKTPAVAPTAGVFAALRPIKKEEKKEMNGVLI